MVGQKKFLASSSTDCRGGMLTVTPKIFTQRTQQQEKSREKNMFMSERTRVSHEEERKSKDGQARYVSSPGKLLFTFTLLS